MIEGQQTETIALFCILNITTLKIKLSVVVLLYLGLNFTF